MNTSRQDASNVNDRPSLTLDAISGALQEGVATAMASVARVSGRRGYALSGIAMDPDHILTTSRAVATDGDVVVATGAEGDALDAEVVGADVHLDVALLRVPGHGLPAARFAAAAEARVGEIVLRTSRSRGAAEATWGIVRSVGGAWRTPWGARFPVSIRVDAAPFRGFSGGPVVRASGAVLGMSTAALSRRRDDVIPSETLERVATQLREHGKVQRGYLGVSVQPVSVPEAMAEAVGGRRAVLIAGIADDAPAAGSLIVGDILVSLAGEAVPDPASLVGSLDEHAPGTKVSARIVRGGTPMEVEVEVGVRD